MKQKLQLQIPEPCHENWNNMTETQQGRFCMSCKKEVVDFSVMSDKEILGYISTASSSICGHVQNNQLNRDLIAPREPKKIWWRHWVSIAASFVLLSGKSNAQVKKHKDPVVAVPLGNNKNIQDVVVGGMIAYTPEYKRGTVIRGRVVDERNNPVPYATVRIKYNTAGVAADAEGYFVLYAKPVYDEIDLQISSVGYKSQSVEVDMSEIEDHKIDVRNIMLKALKMDTVVVTANQLFSMRAGGLVVGRRVTRIEKVKNIVKEVFVANEVKVYPNPIAANSIFNISFNIKDLGEYALQFTDASGKIISSSQLNIVSKNQVQSFNGNMFNGHGLYFVSVTCKKTMKMFTSKLIVQ